MDASVLCVISLWLEGRMDKINKERFLLATKKREEGQDACLHAKLRFG